MREIKREREKERKRESYKLHLIMVNWLNAANWFVESWASLSKNKYEHYLHFYFHFQQTKIEILLKKILAITKHRFLTRLSDKSCNQMITVFRLNYLDKDNLFLNVEFHI